MSNLCTGLDFNTKINNNILEYFSKISFSGSISSVEEYYNYVDVSLENNNSILAYSDGATLYIASDSTIVANKDCSYMFSGFNLSEEIYDGNLDCRKIENMDYMYRYFQYSGYNAFKPLSSPVVKSMRSMFESSTINHVDLSAFESKNIDNLTSLFFGSTIEHVDLTNFVTKDISNMFSGCTNLREIDLGVITGEINNINDIFFNCNSLGLIVMPSATFTDKVKNLDIFPSTMYDLTLSNSIFKGVESISSLFSGNQQLNRVSFLGTSFPKLTDMSNLFNDCNNLLDVDFSGVITGDIKNTANMFYRCNNLQNLDLSSLSFTGINNMYGMFDGCTALTSVNLPNLIRTENPLNISYMFYDCSGLTDIDLSCIYAKNLSNIELAFCNCYSVTKINIKNLDTSKIINMSSVFQNCNSLKEIIGEISTKSIGNINYLFDACHNLVTSITISSIPSSYVNAFYSSSPSGCITVNYEIDCQDIAKILIEQSYGLAVLGDVVLPSIIKINKIQQTSTLIESTESLKKMKETIDSCKERLSIILRSKGVSATKNEKLTALIDKVYTIEVNNGIQNLSKDIKNIHNKLK